MHWAPSTLGHLREMVEYMIENSPQGEDTHIGKSREPRGRASVAIA